MRGRETAEKGGGDRESELVSEMLRPGDPKTTHCRIAQQKGKRPRNPFYKELTRKWRCGVGQKGEKRAGLPERREKKKKIKRLCSA